MAHIRDQKAYSQRPTVTVFACRFSIAITSLVCMPHVANCSVDGGDGSALPQNHNWEPMLPLTLEQLQKSLTYHGDTAHLIRVLCTARRGDPVQIITMGGSLTAGSEVGANNAWPVLFQEWLQENNFSSTTVSNIAISSCGSDCWSENVRSKFNEVKKKGIKATICILEMGLNDDSVGIDTKTHKKFRYKDTDSMQKWFETLLRIVAGLKDDGGHTPAILVYEGFRQSKLPNPFFSGQNAHDMLSRYYDIPTISQRDAIFHEYITAQKPKKGTSISKDMLWRCLFPLRCDHILNWCDVCKETNIYKRQFSGAHPNMGGQRVWAHILEYYWDLAFERLDDNICNDSTEGNVTWTFLSPMFMSADDVELLTYERTIVLSNKDRINKAIVKRSTSGWQYRSDRIGKEVGWVIETKTSSGIPMSKSVTCDPHNPHKMCIVFPMAITHGHVQVGYLQSYENMGRVKVSILSQTNNASLCVPHVIDALQKFPRSSGKHVIRIRVPGETQPSAAYFVVEHIQTHNRGLNKFKLLSLTVY